MKLLIYCNNAVIPVGNVWLQPRCGLRILLRELNGYHVKRPK
jgi:hypothetical protein